MINKEYFILSYTKNAYHNYYRDETANATETFMAHKIPENWEKIGIYSRGPI